MPAQAGLQKHGQRRFFFLFYNTVACSSEIFSGASQSLPNGQIEAARASGMTRFQTFRCVIFPNMLRHARPAYMNEAIFLFHSTTLVFFWVFQHGGRKVKRFITRHILRKRRLTRMCLIQLLRAISFC